MAPEIDHNKQPCNLAVKLNTEIETLKTSDVDQWAALKSLGDKIESAIEKFAASMASMQEKANIAYKEIQEKYSNRLPNWATFLLAALASLATGLIVALVK